MSKLRTLQTSYDIIDACLRAENEYALVASPEEFVRIRELLAQMIREEMSVISTVSEEA